MHIVCLDLEGVLVPEIWFAFAESTGIEKLRLTTRDIPDYNVLMKKRLAILAEHRLTLGDIQAVIKRLDPLPGADQFLEELRSAVQVIILSDTFTEFAQPLMQKLRWPTLFCNHLTIDSSGAIVGYNLRIQDGKRVSVEALHRIGFKVIASGDSYNDISMLKEADFGFLFRPPESITLEYPEFPSATEYSKLKSLIQNALTGSDTGCIK